MKKYFLGALLGFILGFGASATATHVTDPATLTVRNHTPAAILCTTPGAADLPTLKAFYDCYVKHLVDSHGYSP